MSPGAPAEKFFVVIIYERLTYVRKAMAAYLHLMRELADDFAPDFRLWRMDIALMPAFAAEAERDIASAQVIIIAVNGSQPCPSAFQRWRGEVGPGDGPPPRAVIAVIAEINETTVAPECWHDVMRTAARQIHPEIFVCDPPSYPAAIDHQTTASLEKPI
jgi:hypothetical protein